jgi:DNA processing protein
MGESKKYWLGFSHVPGIGSARLKRLIEHFGGVEQAWRASKMELAASGLPAKPLAALVRSQRDLDLNNLSDRLDEQGFQAITWGDPQYPAQLLEMHDPPPVLYLWGELNPSDRWSVAVVGTRRASAYGRQIAEDIGRGLGRNGITVVSGLARGIDGIAHRAVLEAGGRTLAVLGSGLDYIYPPEHKRLALEIAQSGAVISDYPLGTPPEAGNFPPRNRIISGLAMAAIIVEAGKSSGALITAEFGAEQGREVFAVPGPINSPNSLGANRLIRDGAHPYLELEDVLEALNLELAVRQQAVQQKLPADKTERELLARLSHEPVHIDALQRELGQPVAKITASLALLELKGQVRQVGGMRYVLARERGPEYSVG